MARDGPSEGNRLKPDQVLCHLLLGVPWPSQPHSRRAAMDQTTALVLTPFLRIAPWYSRLVPESKLHKTSLPTSTDSHSALLPGLSAGALLTGCPKPSGCHAWESHSTASSQDLSALPGAMLSLSQWSAKYPSTPLSHPTKRYCRKCSTSLDQACHTFDTSFQDVRNIEFILAGS